MNLFIAILMTIFALGVSIAVIMTYDRICKECSKGKCREVKRYKFKDEQ